MNPAGAILLGYRKLMQLLAHTERPPFSLSTLLGRFGRPNLSVVGGTRQFTQLQLGD